jgi:hypothetical protein
MKRGLFLSCLLLLALLACQSANIQVEPKVNSQETVQKERSATESENLADSNLSPTAVQNCFPKIKLDEPIEFDLSVNPFYLRIDFDSNKKIDYAIRIRGKKTKAEGLLICLDGEKPYIFGKLAKSKTPLTDIEGDNFLMDNWDVVPKEEMKSSPTYPPDGKKREGENAKGEAIVFAFPIDGVRYVYWDGKTFRSFGE